MNIREDQAFLTLSTRNMELLELAKERGDIDQCKLAAYEVSDDQWGIREIFATFEDPTLDLQGLKYSTISLTIPHVYGVLKKLDAVLSTPDSNNKDLKERNPYLSREVHEARRKILITTLYTMIISAVSKHYILGLLLILG